MLISVEFGPRATDPKEDACDERVSRRLLPTFSVVTCLLLFGTGTLSSPLHAESSPAPGRRLVVCLDGTWNNAYAAKNRTEQGGTVLKPSNVLKLCRSVLPRDEATDRDQVSYYDVGVGASTLYPGVTNRLLYRADRILGGAWGAGFESNVEAALGFIAYNHRAGDEVFVFGFSRGAAAAQALTRYLDWAGGLPRKADVYYLPLLFRAYIVSRGQRPFEAVVAELNAKRVAENPPRAPLAAMHPVTVRFLGVWDTVLTLGSRFRARGETTSSAGRSFHVGIAPPRCVLHARQALAIDEARYDFRPEIWRQHGAEQTLEQRWFAGVHSNVGGGYVDDGLANLAFHWILEQAQAQGLAVDTRFAGIYGGYAQDRLYRSESVLYRILDGLRFRFGRGRRSMLSYPESARLTVDPSVIWRLNADPEHHAEMQGKRYAPPNLLQFLACQEDLDEYLEGLGQKDPLPDHVNLEIQRLRPACVRTTGSGPAPEARL